MLMRRPLGLENAADHAIVILASEQDLLYTDPRIAAMVGTARNRAGFAGRTDQLVFLCDLPEPAGAGAFIVGIGPVARVDAEALRTGAGRAIKNAMDKGFAKALMAVPSSAHLALEPALVLEATMEGAFLANSVFDRYKSEKKKKPLERIAFWTGKGAAGALATTVHRVTVIGEAVVQARNWVNTPPNDKRPEQLADQFSALAGDQGLGVEILDEKALRRKGFGAMLAVAAGSQSPPRLVLLSHRAGPEKTTVALVGKGVTFDAGGLNLKPATSMTDMKTDMAGAAAAAAAVIAAARLNLPLNVVVALPLVENMPSGRACRPGDIVTAVNGKTIEIGNTDAEGRLILADTLAYVISRFKPQALIDLATLTGACVVALGEKIAGLFSTDEALAATILDAAHRTGERCWRLPMPDDYRDLLKSEAADMGNVGQDRWAGAIVGALFLSHFAEGTRWAHIDIAGPVWAKKETAYGGAGATGFGVRLMVEVLNRLGGSGLFS